ncbi:MAG TPA: 7-cyano-7-deazaguanine synthase QueC [Woeseiaceae bacterium]|nr:7-cyano-7-deazaguanine synthase QueC [Woeseiaceae bacterium]
MKQKALVILSGGQDSTTCVWWAIERFGQESVESLTFDYRQLHRHELHAARQVAAHAGIPNVVLPINTFEALGGSALTDPSIEVPRTTESDSLPVTFVPGRNLVFLTFAAAYAWRHDIQHLVTGVAQTDYSGYPDCRRDTIDSLEKTLALGLERHFTIHTPLMNLSKKETVLLAKELGAMDAMALTHTCYNGSVPPCGECAACILRAKGFAEAGIPDPLIA